MVCWRGFDNTEKLSHYKHPVEVRTRGGPKSQPLQLRKTSLYSLVRVRVKKGEGMETGDDWKGEIVENNGKKTKGGGERRGRENGEKTRETDGIVAVSASSSQ